MDYVVIDGKAYDVIVEKVSESFNVLHSDKTGRSTAIGAEMIFDPLGTFYGHKVTFKRKKGKEAEFDALWDFVSTPRYYGVPVILPHNQGTLNYTAYITQGERTLKRIDQRSGTLYWDSFDANIIPVKAQVLPGD